MLDHPLYVDRDGGTILHQAVDLRAKEAVMLLAPTEGESADPVSCERMYSQVLEEHEHLPRRRIVCKLTD